MPESRQIPNSRNASKPTVEVKVEGNVLPRNFKLVEFIIVKEINRIAFAKMIFADGDPATGRFDLSDSDWMDNGKDISISCGYEGSNDEVFKGIVWKHRILIKSDQSILQVEARDKAVLMTMTENNKVFEEMNDGEIIEEIISQAGQTVSLNGSFNVLNEKMVQYAATDWDFIVSRAEANGALTRTENNTLEVFEPDTDQEEKIDLVLGATILEMDTELNSENQFESVENKGWSFGEQEVISNEVDEIIAGGGSIGTSEIAEKTGAVKSASNYSSISNGQELLEIANSADIKNKLSRIKGTVKSQGFSGIKPGDMLKLTGVGEKFNGKSFVSAVSQVFKNGNWFTSYQIGLTEEYHLQIFNPKAKTQYVLPVTNGLETAKVLELVDPEGENRIKIHLTTFDSNNGIWARQSNFDAGDSRGSIFRPEVGDEVIVGFVNNDPRAPIILGMLNSSAFPSPIEATNNNDEKGIVTRSGSKIVFNDAKNSITIETLNGKKVVLSDEDATILIEDENGNKLEMSSSAIKMESAGDVEIKSSGDIKIEGMNVNISANAQFKAEGSAGVELSTGASAVIKGSLVQIN